MYIMPIMNGVMKTVLLHNHMNNGNYHPKLYGCEARLQFKMCAPAASADPIKWTSKEVVWNEENIIKNYFIRT